MRKRQCRNCNTPHQSSDKDCGIVQKTEETYIKLPGFKETGRNSPFFYVRIYYVKCPNCGNEWMYRKKIR